MKKTVLIFSAAGALCLLAAILSLTLGASGFWLRELISGVMEPESVAGRIFWLIRLPRTLGCLASGAALAVSGCVIQGVLANPLASPGIIGVNAGAGLAVTVCCGLGTVSGWFISGASFLGAALAVSLVVFLGNRTGASRTTLILSGVAVNAFLNGLRDAVTTLLPTAGVLSGDFRVGGFSGVSSGRLMPALVLIALGFLGICTLLGDLDVLTLGEDTARALGMNVKRIRTVLLGLAALLAGSSVSFAGLLSFVGLIVPHGARRLVGGENRFLVPLSALGGAALVTLADVFARLAFAPYELPVGIFLSVLGGPFFLWLLHKHRGGRSDAGM